MNSSDQFTNGNSKNPNLKIAAPPAQPLLTKELAASLGVSLRFVYQMRACGFPMHGDTRYRQKATLEDARDWIQANSFRLKDSVGVTDAANHRRRNRRHGNNISATTAHERQG